MYIPDYQRIDLIIKNCEKGSQLDFCNTTGFKQNNVSNYVNNKSRIPLEVAEKIKKKYPFVNSDWLLTGNGEMFLNKESTQIANTENVQNTNTTDGNGNTSYNSSVHSKKNEGIIHAPLTVGDANVASLENQVSTLSEQLAFAQAQLVAKDAQIQGLLRLLENKT
jgi:hypothetical protein